MAVLPRHTPAALAAPSRLARWTSTEAKAGQEDTDEPDAADEAAQASKKKRNTTGELLPAPRIDDFPPSLHPDLVAGLRAMGIQTATEIQKRAFLSVHEGNHTIITAETGSGKTLAYLVPIIDRLLKIRERTPHNKHSQSPRVLVLAPSRHLQLQIMHVLQALTQSGEKRLPLTCTVLPPPPGLPPALTANPDIAISSPAAVLEHFKKPRDFRSLVERTEVVVMDEADWLITDGTGSDALELFRAAGRKRPETHPLQVVCASATLAPVKTKNSRVPRAVILKALRKVWLASTDALHATSDRVRERFVYMLDLAADDRAGEIDAKSRELHNLVVAAARTDSTASDKWIVFCGAPSRADAAHTELSKRLADSAKAAPFMRNVRLLLLHGDMERQERTHSILEFAEMPTAARDDGDPGSISILIATDLVSRGVDFKDVTHAVHFDFPSDASDYLHRVGRIARSQTASGESVGFVTERQEELARLIEEASCGIDGVKSIRLLNHNSFAEAMERGSTSKAFGDGGSDESFGIESQPRAGKKFPLTGIISRKRSFSK
ncbi:hypothetical protein HK105_207664 [Polyrhizophydium stewartii]|uniref:RNA helicase n=1 Tax=Polyrhizophydium stewartii TaxID=2732419 RepID=A0ABR4N030_9FUNG